MHPAPLTLLMGSKNQRYQGSQIKEQKSGIAKSAVDIDRQSTTIRLWINWIQHLRLCLIQPGGE
jgi:hypothetical protein